MSTTKKYKLFSTPPGGGKAPCAFFATPAGCRQGDACKFSHGSVVKSEDRFEAEVVSSESEPEIEKPVVKKAKPAAKAAAKAKPALKAAAAKPALKAAAAKPKPAVKQETTEDNPFLSPGEGRSDPSESTQKNRRGKRSEDHLPFANPKKKAKTAAAAQEAPPTSKPTKSPPKPKKAAFLSLNLPIASFSLPSTPGATKAASKKRKTEDEESEETSDKDTSNTSSKVAAPKQLPLPNSTDVGRKWLKAVKETQIARRFAGDYDFDRYRKADDEHDICTQEEGWIKLKPYGKWCADAPQSIAIDCEMCETQDPVSGNKNHKALCRISIVDAETKETLLDTLVKPDWPVTNYRTFVNGIKKEHLEKVQFTIQHAQAFMMALCSQETVIIGHAVHNDLVATRMESHCVADSACLFKAADSETATVSLKDLASNILKKEMPETHDSVNDAITALLCLEHYIEKDGQVELIERSARKPRDFRDPNVKSFEYYACQLFIHRIPKSVDESHISKLFLSHSDIQPTEVKPLEYVDGGHGKTHVTFASKRHADLAFDCLEGSKPDQDPSGRLQKKIFLRNKSYIKIRKMAFENKKEKTESSTRKSIG